MVNNDMYLTSAVVSGEELGDRGLLRLSNQDIVHLGLEKTKRCGIILLLSQNVSQ
ncbi:hypothetical protein J41TS4_33180 [Paenibacillus apis]|uniref:Uncharacterized protein n=1 Tax=Paenibacillus apis TaxID=1792174 RepID=A0A919Y741_9BACL|nr:hypothetical protein J41TS4_33180 [Paenibacillus apis]